MPSLLPEARQLAVCVLSDAPHSGLGISDVAIGLGLGEPLGLVCALVRGDQDCRDLLPGSGNLGGRVAFERPGSLHVHEFAVALNEFLLELADFLLELSEPLIDDGAVIPLSGN